VPWKDLTIANDDYLIEGSLPKDNKLCEPSKLKQFAVINLWNYWRKEQLQGHPGLEFKLAKKEDMCHGKGKDKGKQKAPVLPFVDPDAEDPEGSSRSTPDPPSIMDSDQPGPSSHRQKRLLSPTDRDPLTPSNDSDHEDNVIQLDTECPEYHMKMKKGCLLFLKLLSDAIEYTSMLKAMQRIKVTNYDICVCSIE
jgi:hypothetical protein